MASENTTGDIVSCRGNEPIVCASGTELTCAVADASHDSLLLCGEEDSSSVQGRLAREPIDRSRYVVVNGSGGAAMFVCSRCSKQYIHRKSLNKHWNDKHADDDSTDSRTKYLTSTATCSVSEALSNRFNVQLVQCPDTVAVTLSGGPSLLRPAVHSYAVNPAVPSAGSTQLQDTRYGDMHRSRVRRSGSITDSALWHSLAAIHLNQEEHDLNSFHRTPMPAHISGHHDGRESFLKQLFYDDDCQVLDLSKGSCDARELLSNVSVADGPVDLSVKSHNTCLAGDSEKPALPRTTETAGESAKSCCSEVSEVDALIINTPESANAWAVGLPGSVKVGESAQLDSVALLRHLHFGVLTNATNKSVRAASGCRSAAAFVSDQLKSYQLEVEPSTKRERRHNSMHFKNHPNVISKLPVVATLKETHEFFGGISRGGHIRCKVCEFTATSILLFSQHVARHVRKANTSGISVQNDCVDGTGKEYGFFIQLGLHRVNGAEVDSVQRSSATWQRPEIDSMNADESSDGRCEAAVVNDGSELGLPEAQANGVRSHPEGAFGQQREKTSGGSTAVRQKRRAGYQRGLGLTTTESRYAAGRSWRRRRLRTCERCGYVTDNLTTLKRHEEKHGAPGMYRCKLCDYAVNQQHILEYHTRNVHRPPPRQTATANSSSFKDTDMPLDDNTVDERWARTVSSSAGNDNQASWTEGLPDTVTTGNSANQGGRAAFSFSSEVAEVHSTQSAISRYSMMKAISKNVEYPTSVAQARRQLLDAFDLQVGRGVCIRCGFRSLGNVTMKQHALRHPHDRHACALCPHTSVTARLLSKHAGQHSDCRTTGYLAQKRAYPCPECPFLAASPHRLQCHSQFHGVRLRHVCGKCSYSVDRANLIAQHRRLHSSASVAVQKRCWLQCSKCPFRTINKASLANHERGHYAGSCPYVCGLCSFRTDVANVAFRHQRLHSRAN